MADSKRGIVVLKCKNVEREFELAHAKRLIALQVKKGRSDWKLPKGSKYQIKGDELIKRPSKGAAEE